MQRDAAVPRVATVRVNTVPLAKRRSALNNAPPPMAAPAQPPAQAVGGQVEFANRTPTTALPAAGARRTGVRRMGGALAGGGTFAAPQVKPTATGVRPIRIEVPRTGQAFSFTKVLNAGQEPLTASFSMMRLKVYRAEQMVVQVCAFVLGLIMLWWLSLRPDRSSLWVTVAVVFILWSVQRLLTIDSDARIGAQNRQLPAKSEWG